MLRGNILAFRLQSRRTRRATRPTAAAITGNLDMSNDLNDVRKSYDIVADEYVRRIYDELQHKPLDRQLLDEFAERVRSAGPVCDLGCGPGHVARYLHDRGVEVLGLDLSESMIKQARRLNHDVRFQVGNILALESPDKAWAGIVAFYSIVNLPAESLPTAAAEMLRVLRPGGRLLLSFHIGEETLHLDQWWDRDVSIDFYFYQPVRIADLLARAGFVIDEIVEREPYAEVEHQSRRAYIVARAG